MAARTSLERPNFGLNGAQRDNISKFITYLIEIFSSRFMLMKYNTSCFEYHHQPRCVRVCTRCPLVTRRIVFLKLMPRDRWSDHLYG